MKFLNSAIAILALMSWVTIGEAADHVDVFTLSDTEREKLSDEQEAFAVRIMEFLRAMDEKHIGRAMALNGSEDIERRDFVYDFADYETRVTRGPVVEKIGRMMGRTKRPNSDLQKETNFSRFFGIDVHPKSPKVGMLHATLVFQFVSDGTSHIGGWVDALQPGEAMSKDDIALLKQTLDADLLEHDVDGTGFRERVCGKLYISLEKGKYDRRGACAGASYYGPDMMPINEKNLTFIIDAYDSFFSAYMDIIEARKDEPITDEDIAAQEAMRKNWFEDQTFADPYAAQQITPYEVWSFTFLPPAVKF